MAASFTECLERFEPIGLEALDAQAALQQRVDQKYLVAPADLEPLLERLLPGFVALEIDGRRQSLYESTYFDTPGLRFLEDAVGGDAPQVSLVELGPVLTTRYRRATLAAREGGVRVTFDDDVRASLPGGARGELTPGRVIVETKSADGESEADALLREAGHEPASLSKYRAGIERLVPAGAR